MPRSMNQSINEKPEMCSIDWTIVSAARSGSSQASQSSVDICRICHCENDSQNPLLTPCYCAGSLKYVHQSCLQQWLTASDTSSCELCKFPFIMHTKIKPFNEWKSLDMSTVERRRLFCAILFHFAAAICVVWSLCVLIDRGIEEYQGNQLGWPFYTKLVVVTVGFTGGIVFMYIQCKQYLQLCGRWRARNRILLIQNAPEKMHISHSPVLPRRYGNSVATGSISNNSASLYRTDYYDCSAHAQVLANIESAAMSSERDWILDDVSQVSFKPCRLGSGSLTPFHDSINNMFDQHTNKSLRSDSTTSGPLTSGHPISGEQRSVGSGAYKVRCLDSAVFLENADILNENSGKKYYRHSSVLLSPGEKEPPARRYSDTKLLGPTGKQLNLKEIMGEEHVEEVSSPRTHTLFKSTPNVSPFRHTSCKASACLIENNLRKLVDDYVEEGKKAKKQMSLENVLQKTSHLEAVQGVEELGEEALRNSDVFKSLPNLISSPNATLPK